MFYNEPLSITWLNVIKSIIYIQKALIKTIRMHVYFWRHKKLFQFNLHILSYLLFIRLCLFWFLLISYITKSNGKSKNAQINFIIIVYFIILFYYICLFLNIKLIIINDDFSIFEFQNQILKIHFVKFQSSFFIFT